MPQRLEILWRLRATDPEIDLVPCLPPRTNVLVGAGDLGQLADAVRVERRHLRVGHLRREPPLVTLPLGIGALQVPLETFALLLVAPEVVQPLAEHLQDAFGDLLLDELCRMLLGHRAVPRVRKLLLPRVQRVDLVVERVDAF